MHPSSQFAIYYAGDAYSTSNKIMGRQSAGKAFMKGIARTYPEGEVRGLGANPQGAKEMASQLEKPEMQVPRMLLMLSLKKWSKKYRIYLYKAAQLGSLFYRTSIHVWSANSFTDATHFLNGPEPPHSFGPIKERKWVSSFFSYR